MMKDREEGSGNRDQETQRVEQVLRSVMPRVSEEPDLDRDLWPAMLQRMDRENVRSAARVPWFDWALAGGLVAFAALAPRTIPVILYYL